MTLNLHLEGLRSASGNFEIGPIDLSVPSGDTLVVTGPSGSGKTTLLRAMAGFLPPLSGRVFIDGMDHTRTPPEFRGLGYVPQGLGLLPHRTVEANIRFPLEIRGWPEARKRTSELMESWGLTAKSRSYPQELSGGEQQRVAMARAVAAEPRALLWDEPLTALDAEARAGLLQVIEDFKDRTQVALLLVTHDPGLALDLADKILVLDRGQVVTTGNCSDLLKDPETPFIARFLGYENVIPRGALEDLRSPMSRWLGVHAGPGGIAFGAEAVRISRDPAPACWEGKGRHRRWTRSGAHLNVDVDGLVLEGYLSGPSDGHQATGTLYVTIDEDLLHPLGRAGKVIR